MVLFRILSVVKGGGYHYCRTDPVHPKANSKGLYPLHRVVVENSVGRVLAETEVVHHRDENKNNNSLDNLAVMSREEHSAEHAKERAVGAIEIVCQCGVTFYVKPTDYRKRLKRSKHNQIYCSPSCGGYYSR